jgi:hypothetical protein
MVKMAPVLTLLLALVSLGASEVSSPFILGCPVLDEHAEPPIAGIIVYACTVEQPLSDGRRRVVIYALVETESGKYRWYDLTALVVDRKRRGPLQKRPIVTEERVPIQRGEK